MRDLPNPSLIDKEFSPPPVEVPSWGMIGVVFFMFVVFALLCGFLDVRMQFS